MIGTGDIHVEDWNCFNFNLGLNLRKRGPRIRSRRWRAGGLASTTRLRPRSKVGSATLAASSQGAFIRSRRWRGDGAWPPRRGCAPGPMLGPQPWQPAGGTPRCAAPAPGLQARRQAGEESRQQGRVGASRTRARGVTASGAAAHASNPAAHLAGKAVAYSAYRKSSGGL